MLTRSCCQEKSVSSEILLILDLILKISLLSPGNCFHSFFLVFRIHASATAREQSRMHLSHTASRLACTSHSMSRVSARGKLTTACCLPLCLCWTGAPPSLRSLRLLHSSRASASAAAAIVPSSASHLREASASQTPVTHLQETMICDWHRKMVSKWSRIDSRTHTRAGKPVIKGISGGR